MSAVKQSLPERHDVPGPAAKILIVDDERMNLAILSRLLKQQGHHAIGADSGFSALDALGDEIFDLVLLDLQMPDLDGSTVLQMIRETKDQFELPVIMLTASDDRQQIVRMFQMGASDFITKPFDPEVLLARVDVQLRLKFALAAVRQSEERYALVSCATNDGLWDWDLSRDQVYYSGRWNGICGLEEKEVTGSIHRWLDRVHPDDQERLTETLERHRYGAQPQFDTEFRIQHEDGQHRWVVCRGVVVKDAAGCNRRMAGSMTDITGGKVADILTGLPNRLLFTERVKRCFQDYQRDPRKQCAILYLDLDNFKYINDTFGHAAGDLVLMSAARRLESVIRADDAVAARFGGDEFAVLLESISDIADAVKISQRIREVLTSPISIQGRDVYTQASIGVAMISPEMGNVDELLRQADIAMYDAKSQGKCRTSVFDPTMHARSQARCKLESDLRQALSRQEFCLHYQPIVDMTTKKLRSLEALVRWRHPDGRLVPPVEFIPLAEEIGLILPLGEWIFEAACRQLAEWRANRPLQQPFSVGVNISTRQLTQPNFVEGILRMSQRWGLSGDSFKLEVTESAFMKNPEQVCEMLRSLRQHGFRIAVDDFGTGFSSLAYLHQLPLDILKIDRSFVRCLDNRQRGGAIVRTILLLAKNLQLEVIAEGIDSQSQFDELEHLGCDFGQGYLVAAPIPADRMGQILETLPESDEFPFFRDGDTTGD